MVQKVEQLKADGTPKGLLIEGSDLTEILSGDDTKR